MFSIEWQNAIIVLFYCKYQTYHFTNSTVEALSSLFHIQVFCNFLKSLKNPEHANLKNLTARFWLSRAKVSRNTYLHKILIFKSVQKCLEIFKLDFFLNFELDMLIIVRKPIIFVKFISIILV